ncbi:copper transport protein [Allocatelliglobosispora scoriae]|uniref:Copper transport protein n=1 Tax=Allocatelliglobosispora scoriae TaxID=643052 RepID=A0A841BT74_9ACTN|nr:copper resistance protein CopC [Allocatelliglobosispora scoriae]MBB5870123.1 copper transport protein [Allocatelliglobosispora scoriae]
MKKFLAVAALLISAFLLVPAAPAFAHAALLGTNPGQGSIVQTAPSDVTLTFSEPVSPVSDKIRIIGPDGERADRGTPSADGTVLKIGLRDSPPIGTYLVTYRVISADSHPVAGGFTFSVGAPSATPPTDKAADQGTDPTVTKAIGINKFIGYAGLTLIAGPALVLLLLWPARLSRRGPRRLLWTGFGLVGFSSLAALFLQAPYTNGTSLGGVTTGDLTDVLGETFGTVLLLRLGVLVISAIVLNATLKRDAPARSDLMILAILGAVGAATWPLVGHPAASPVPTITIVVDAIHLASMALWIGGLVMLGFFLLPRNRGADDRELGAILPVWSRWAGLAVSSLLLAGVVQALIEVGTVSALVDTTYGRLLLVKAGLVAIVLAVAFASRTLVVRSGSPSTLRRNVLIEVAVAAVIIGITSALVQTTPARVARTDSAAPVTVGFNTAITGKLYSLQVQVEPAAIGENTIHLYAYTADGRPQKVLEWKVTATQAAQGIEGVDVPMLGITDNHASGSISLPVAGDWVFKFTLRTTEIDQETVTATVPIR